MQADPDKWDDSELINAVRRGLENLDAGAAAEDEDEMAEADARFAALLEAPVPATTPATAASPVKDPTVGEYGEWSPSRPGAAAAPRRHRRRPSRRRARRGGPPDVGELVLRGLLPGPLPRRAGGRGK